MIGQPDCALHSEAARRGAAGGPRSIERQGRDYREIGKGRRAEGGSVRSARELVGALPRQHTHALRNTPPETRASTLAHTGKPAVARLVGPAREPRRQPAARSRPADPSHAISEIPSHAIRHFGPAGRCGGGGGDNVAAEIGAGGGGAYRRQRRASLIRLEDRCGV